MHGMHDMHGTHAMHDTHAMRRTDARTVCTPHRQGPSIPSMRSVVVRSAGRPQGLAGRVRGGPVIANGQWQHCMQSTGTLDAIRIDNLSKDLA